MTADIRLGYALSSEEHRPLDLVANARRAEEAGFDHVYLNQVGPDQSGFLRFAEQELLPRLTSRRTRRRRAA